jgi:hypothetical protein
MIASRVPCAAVLAGACCLLLATAALAQPDPLGAPLFLFPGFHPSPATATSAGLAMSERWLGEDVFDNPAVAARRRLAVSPLLVRMSRQDLSSDNRAFEESTFLDGASVQLVVPIADLGLLLYAAQPVLRLENLAYTRGQIPEPGQPARVGGETNAREVHAGAGLSTRFLGLGWGAAIEWTRRDDRYLAREDNGGPSSGTREASFAGSGFGAQAGVRGSWPSWGPLGRTTIGLSARFVPELTLEGTRDTDQLLGTSSTPIAATREAGYEAGVSISSFVTRTFRVVLGGGGRTAQELTGFDVTSGRQAMASIGGEFRDPESPWAFRVGLGLEQQDDSPESHAGIVGIGTEWRDAPLHIGLGITRRSFKRPDSPTSFDNRVVLTVSLEH